MGGEHYGKSPVEHAREIREALPEWAAEEYVSGEGPITTPGVHVTAEGDAHGAVGASPPTPESFAEADMDEYAKGVAAAFGDGEGGPGGAAAAPMITGGSVSFDNNLQPAHPNCRSSTVPYGEREISMSVDVELDAEDMEAVREAFEDAADVAVDRAKRRTPNLR